MDILLRVYNHMKQERWTSKNCLDIQAFFPFSLKNPSQKPDRIIKNLELISNGLDSNLIILSS